MRYFTNQLLEDPKSCWQVSSHGRLCNTKGVISMGSFDCGGYRRVSIFGESFKVHRVVKITFHGLPTFQEAWQVHHIDGNRANNRLGNLEYVTHSQNMQHSFSNPTRSSSGPAHSKPVLWRPAGSMSWTTSPSLTAAAQQLGINVGTLSRCCCKKSAAKGYEFRYHAASELTLPGEEWQQMVDPRSGALVPGRMVSSLGRITSRTGLISRGYRTNSGYYATALTLNSHRQGALVHRLVAFAWLGPPPSDHKIFVNHKDLDKRNNSAGNLEWVSAWENRTHFLRASTLGFGTSAKPVWSQAYGMNDKWTWHYSLTSAASELGVCRHGIYRCIHGLQRQTGGFEFQLAGALDTDPVPPGEEWRTVDMAALRHDKESRRCSPTRSEMLPFVHE